MGHAVLEISPAGRVLMTIGTPGVSGKGPYAFDRPAGVARNALRGNDLKAACAALKRNMQSAREPIVAWLKARESRLGSRQ